MIINVATAVIYGVGEPGHPHGAKGHCLYTLRRDNVMRPNMWEHPGGKINPGEYVREAAIREAYEELGVVIEVEHTLTTVSFDLVTHAVVLTAVAAHIANGEPTPLPLESKALQWQRPQNAVDSLPCTPGTYLIHRAVIEWMEGHY